MKLLKRLAPFLVIVAAAALLLYIPDAGPERYTDLATFFRVELKRQAYAGYIVAAVEKGSVLYVDAFGKDGVGRALEADTPVFIGEASACFAATVARSLVGEGRLSLDRPVKRYLPWFGFAGGGGADVTPRHLLSHSSGVREGDFDDVHEFAPDLEAVARSLATARPFAAPGAAFSYLDTGYQALGLVMEKATGKSYPDLVAERVFRPLGMKRSTARPELLGAALPVGSASFFGMALPRAGAVRPFEAPSSSVLSTASDLGLYLAFLAAPERLKRPPLSPAAVRSLFLPLLPGGSYGYGWSLEGEGAARRATHEGSMEGFSSVLVLWPELKAGVAVVAAENSLLQSRISMPALVEGARSILFEGSVARPFPLARLYILLAVAASVHLFVLAVQTGGALRWAKAVRDRAEARGKRGPIVVAALRSWGGILVDAGFSFALPLALGLALGRRVTWNELFAREPGLAAWCASTCFFGLLRNAARLSWLRGSRPARLR